jgi:hypothetical protein
MAGCYDYLEGKCPMCGKVTTVQTKLFENEMRTIRIGSLVDGMEHMQFDILCKEPCQHCGHDLVARFRCNVFEGFVVSKANYRELLFGEIQEVSAEERV